MRIARHPATTSPAAPKESEPTPPQVLAQVLARANSSARHTLTAMAATRGFARLPPPSQVLLLRLVGGGNEELSRPARTAVAALLKTKAFQTGQAPEQRQKLETLLSEQAWLPDVVSAKSGAMQRATFSLTGPSAAPPYPFTSGTADAQRYLLEIDGHPIRVIAAQHTAKGHTQHSVKEIARAIAALPAANRAQIREVALEPATNPADAARAAELNDPDFKSYMVAERGKVWVFASLNGDRTQEDADGTFVHEAGHFLCSLAWGDESDPRWDGWKTAMRSDRLFPSAYAKVSPTEDFCEAFQLYLQVRGTTAEAELRRLLPGRFALIEALLRGPGSR